MIWTFFIAFTASSAETLLFHEALSEMLRRSPDIQQVQEKRRALGYNINSQRLRLLPELEIQKAWEYVKTPKPLKLEGKWVLFQGGSEVATWFADTKRLDGSEQEIAEMRLLAEAQAVKALLKWIRAKGNLRINEALADTRKRLWHTARERFNKGYLPLEEVEKFQVDFEMSAVGVEQAGVELKNEEGPLLELLGHPRVVAEWPWKEDLLRLVPSFEGKPYFSRPDWKALDCAVKALSWQQTADWLKLFPRLEFRTDLNMAGFTPSSLELRIVMPLFGMLSQSLEASATGALRIQREADQVRLQRKLESDWQTLQARLDQVLRVARTQESTWLLSKKLLLRANERLESGKLTANELALEQRRALDAEKLHIQAWFDAHTTYLEYLQLQGRSVLDSR